MTQKPFFKFLRKSNSVHCGKSFKPLESSPWFAFKVRHWLQSFLSFWGCYLACQCLNAFLYGRAWKQLAHGKYPGYFCQFLSSDCACWRYLLLSEHLHLYCFPYIACSNVHSVDLLGIFLAFPPFTFTVRSHIRWCFSCSDAAPVKFASSLCPNIKYFGWFFS